MAMMINEDVTALEPYIFNDKFEAQTEKNQPRANRKPFDEQKLSIIKK